MPSKIRKRGESSYELCVCSGYGSDGKQILYRKTIQAANDTEAKEQYKYFSSEVLQGKALSGATEKMTMKQFFDYWKEKHANKHYAKTTLVNYENAFIRIELALGHLYLHKIKPAHIVEFIAQLNSPTARKDDQPLSPRSIAKHRELLSILLGTAYRWELITSNPMEKISAPRTERKYKEIPTQEEFAKFFQYLSTAPIKNQLMCMLGFTGGLRREEIAGLQWGDFDLQKNTIKIIRTATYIPGEPINISQTKTVSSDRTVSLPTATIKLLEAHKSEVKAQYAKRAKRNKVVTLIDPTAADKWLFTKSDGTIGHPQQLNTFLKRFCEDNELFNITPHTLRHLHGSYLLNSGLDIAAVSKALGHTKKSFTLDTYIHTIQTIEEKTASIMDSVLNDIKTAQNKKGQAK